MTTDSGRAWQPHPPPSVPVSGRRESSSSRSGGDDSGGGGSSSSNNDNRVVQSPRWPALLQNFDLLTAACKQRTIEKCRLTYGSEITVIVSVGRGRRSLDQIFPSFALDPRGRRRFGRQGLASFDVEPSREFLGREVPRFSALVLAFARILPHGRFPGSLEFVAPLDRREGGIPAGRRLQNGGQQLAWSARLKRRQRVLVKLSPDRGQFEAGLVTFVVDVRVHVLPGGHEPNVLRRGRRAAGKVGGGTHQVRIPMVQLRESDGGIGRGRWLSLQRTGDSSGVGFRFVGPGCSVPVSKRAAMGHGGKTYGDLDEGGGRPPAEAVVVAATEEC